MRFLWVAVLLGLAGDGVLAAGPQNPVYVHPKPQKAKKHKVPKHRTGAV